MQYPHSQKPYTTSQIGITYTNYNNVHLSKLHEDTLQGYYINRKFGQSFIY